MVYPIPLGGKTRFVFKLQAATVVFVLSLAGCATSGHQARSGEQKPPSAPNSTGLTSTTQAPPQASPPPPGVAADITGRCKVIVGSNPPGAGVVERINSEVFDVRSQFADPKIRDDKSPLVTQESWNTAVHLPGLGQAGQFRSLSDVYRDIPDGGLHGYTQYLCDHYAEAVHPAEGGGACWGFAPCMGTPATPWQAVFYALQSFCVQPPEVKDQLRNMPSEAGTSNQRVVREGVFKYLCP